MTARRAGERGRHRPRRSNRRWVLVRRIVLGVLAAGIAYYLVTLAQVILAGRSDDARPSDAIVVLGAAQYDGRPSPQLAARLDHAVTLFDDGVAPTIYVTGGSRPGDRFTEAEASKKYLVDHGVPESAIREENYGRTTYGSMQNVATLMPPDSTVVLVTDPYHALRSRLTAREVGLDAVVSPTPTSVVSGGTELRRDLGEAGGVATGRIVGFGRLSHWTG